MTEQIIDDSDGDLVLWRQLLEVDLTEQEVVEWELDDDLDSESRTRVFAKLGIVERGPTARVISEFLINVEHWLASSPPTALARDVGSIAETLEVELPELKLLGVGEGVEIECDVDGNGWISDLAVLIVGNIPGRRLQMILINPAGDEISANVSPYGLARFTALAIDPKQARSLRFEIRG